MSIGIIIAIVVLAIAVLVAYLGGVRQGAAWGSPVLVLGVVGLIAVLVVQMVSGRGGATRPGDGTSMVEASDNAAAMMVAKGLKPHLQPGSRVFLFYPTWGFQEGSFALVQLRNAPMYTLKAGLDDDTMEIAGDHGVEEGALTGQILSRALEGHEDVDAVVSLVGLPENLERLSVVSEPPRPKIGAYFPQGADLGVVRTWLENDSVDVIVVNQEGKLMAYTPDQMP